MIADSFDARTLANMEIALDRACEALGSDSDKHKTRSRVARKILKCARSGDTTLGALTAAGRAAAVELFDHKKRAALIPEPASRVTARTGT